MINHDKSKLFKLVAGTKLKFLITSDVVITDKELRGKVKGEFENTSHHKYLNNST